MKKLALLSLLIMSAFALHAQTGDSLSKKQVHTWFRKKEWLHGLNWKPHRSIDVRAFYQQYTRNQALWDTAFAYLKNTDLASLRPGRYPINGELVFAIVTEANSKDLDSTKWESHRKYIDLQHVITGEEQIGVNPVSKSKPVTAYNTEKDLINYEADGVFHTATPDMFFLFFPGDAHRPNVDAKHKQMVKKIVVKIRVAQ